MKPSVCLIIVFRNARHYLLSAIDSLLQQTYSKSLTEMILIDGMSDDGSWELAEQKCSELLAGGYKVKLLKNLKKTLAPGWNLALKSSESDIVCRIDCHGSIDKDYVEKGVARLLERKTDSVVAVGGVLVNSGEGFWGNIFKDFYSSKFGVGNSPFRTNFEGIFYSDTVAMGLYWKNVFDEIGYFDETLPRNQDISLHKELLGKGYRVVTDASMKFHYCVRSSLKALLKKAWDDGYWIIPSGGGRLRHFIPAFFALYILCYSIQFFLKLKPFTHWFWHLPAFAYTILAFTFACKDGRTKWAKLFLPLIYPSYHLVYGSATIVGIFHPREK